MKSRTVSTLPGLMAITFLLLGGLTACQSTAETTAGGLCYGKVIRTEKGIASWYSVRTNHGTRTASGRKLCDQKMTAAHRKLPFGTPVRVTDERTGKSVVVEITDRGPFKRGRVIDVSLAAAKELGFYNRGLTPVKVEVLEKKVPGVKSL
ncbi:MAG: septal ring lytic transglycosylase RlpA family protein [Verrucomicrobiales bacterium]